MFCYLLAWSLLGVASGQNDGVRCLECHNARTPDSCDNWVMCGRGEICYTREIVNFNDEQAFHMGCENKARCDLFQNARVLFGKRELSDLDIDADQFDAEDQRCYQCCAKDDCNARLCNSYIIDHKHDTSGSKHTTKECPPTFVKGPGGCYFFASWILTWDNARVDCQRRGADLVSINNPQENTFLVDYLNNTDNSTWPKEGYWTGGMYVYATKTWIWVDMDIATSNYTSWGPSSPSASTTDYRIGLVNPITYPTFHDWLWQSFTHTTSMGFVCERDFI